MSTSAESTSIRKKSKQAISSLPAVKIDASTPAGDQIYNMLRQAIVEMRLAPGCPVSEAEVAAKLGASRTPVREALLRLREEGLIITLPSRGNFVATLSRERILESQFIREAIEIANVHKILDTGLSEEYRQLLESNLAAQQDAADKVDYPLYRELDDQFHTLLAQATGLPRVANVLIREKTELDRLRVLSLKFDGQLEALVNDHTAIFKAIVDRDTNKAVDLTCAHCRTVLGVLEDLLIQHEEYFS